MTPSMASGVRACCSEHSLIDFRHWHPQGVRAIAVHATASTHVLRDSSALACARLDNQSTATVGTGRQPRQQISTAVLRWATRQASTFETQRLALGQASSRLDTLPQLLVHDAQPFGFGVNPIRLGTWPLLHLAPRCGGTFLRAVPDEHTVVQVAREDS